jgi:hypothetical protein
VKAIAAALAGAVLAGLAAATPASAGDPIMPLADVQPGMQCEGRSVIRGTDISTFDVEVIDVMRSGPSYLDRILVEVSGPAVDGTGLGPGFSGSPIYCPTGSGLANAGAISEGVGDYGNKVALATPIEEILREPAEVAPAATAGRPGTRPLTSPLTVSGVSPLFASVLRRAARRAGEELVVGPAAAGPGYPAQDLLPGSSTAVGIAAGDLSMGGVGTVAYRDADRVWVFGHPFDGLGRRGLFLQDSYVHTVVNNPVGSFGQATYKLASPGNTLGSIVTDGVSSVAGQIGPLPQRTLVTVTARDANTGETTVEQTEVADESLIGLPGNVSATAPFAVADAGVGLLRGVGGGMSGLMCLYLDVTGRDQPLELCNRYFGDRRLPGAVQAEMAADTEIATSLVDELALRRPIRLESLRVDMALQRGARLLRLERARGPERVRRGGRIRVQAIARPPLGEQRVFSFRVRVPRKLRRGRYRLVLTGGATASSFELLGFEEEVGLERLFARLLSVRNSGDAAQNRDPITTTARLEERLAKLKRYPGIRAQFVRVSEEEEELELLEEIFGELDGEDAKGVQRAYRDPVFGLGGSAAYRLRVVGRPVARNRRN